MKQAIRLDILIMLRSKRLRFFLFFVLYLIALFYYQIHLFSSRGFQTDSILDKMIFLVYQITMPTVIMSFPGSMMLSSFWGIEANFINKTLTLPLDFQIIVKRKYIVAGLISFIIFLLMLPAILLGFTFAELTAAFLFAVGPISFLSLWISIFNNNRFDLIGDIFFNNQGSSSKQQFMFLTLTLIYFIPLLGTCFCSEAAVLWFMSVTGLIFIALNKVWIGQIAKYYERNVLDKIENLV